MPGGALEDVMKNLSMAVIALMVMTEAAHAAPICLATQDMVETQPQKGGASIIFKMRDGSVWRNDLHGSCPDLWFDTGFVWSVKNGDGTVCENEESLHVLRSAEVCELGKFTELTPSRGQQHAER
jgi:hypothetical protein